MQTSTTEQTLVVADYGIEITFLVKDGGPLTKRISLSEGKLHSDGSACVMSIGTAYRYSIPNMAELVFLLTRLESNEAIALGALRDGLPHEVTIVTKNRVDESRRPDVIARTADNLVYRAERHALMLCDYDQKGMPSEVAARLKEVGGFKNAILQLIPQLAGAAHLIRASTSAGIYRTDNDEKFLGSGGEHLYLAVKDGADINRALRALHERCCLSGYGWYNVGAAGQLLELSIVDRMVGSPERLVFEGPPILDYPLKQDDERRHPTTVEGDLLDTFAVMPPLTKAEERRLRAFRRDAEAQLAEEVAKVRAEFIQRHALRLVDRTGMSLEDAERTIRRQCDHVLLGKIELLFDDPRLADKTVADVLNDPKRFEGETLADPIEGVEYGRGKAKVLLRHNTGEPFIHSFAHGGASYELRLDETTPATTEVELPIIEVEPGKRHEAADAAMDALIQAGVAMYQRDAWLAYVARIPMKTSEGTTIYVPAIKDMPTPLLSRHLGQSAFWVKRSKGKEHKLERIDPPGDVAVQLQTMINDWRFSPLRGIIGTQTIRPDGSVLDEPGYDEATGFVLFEPPSMKPIPDELTRDDALRALALLNGLLQEFPFAGEDDIATEASRSVALSMLMTPVLRAGLLPAVPLHVVKSPHPRSGKSFIADLASAIAMGERCPVIARTTEDNERDKRLNTAAIDGTPIFSIDNCNGVLASEFLCQMVERPFVNIRRLGYSQQVKVANTFTGFANGNNIEISGDLIPRTIQCSLDAKMERPKMRKFQYDPMQMILWDRGRYVRAVLIIARTYIMAGMPDKPQPFMSFGGWSDIVRGSLMWLGCADPASTTEKLEDDDPLREKRANVFRAIALLDNQSFPDGYTTADLIDEAKSGNAILRYALESIAPDKNGDIKPERLGWWFRNNLDKRVEGMTLLRTRENSRTRWMVIKEEEE